MRDDDETPDDELEVALTKYTESASKSIREQADAGLKIVEAVRGFLAASPVESEDSGQDEIAAIQKWLLAFGELADNPTRWGHVQALSMLAATVRWFSVESGRSEAEILERLGSVYRETRDEGLSRVEQVARDFRDTGHGD